MSIKQSKKVEFAHPGLPAFLGREREVALVCDAVRLRKVVTLSGPGGVGKSRIAYEAFDQLAPEFKRIAHVINLSDATDLDEIETTLAEGFGVEPSRLLRYLCATRALVLLDNCEGIADTLGDFLRGAIKRPLKARFLVTSRHSILPGIEQTIPIGALKLPGALKNSESPLDVDAVQLLLHRCQLHGVELDVEDRDGESLVSICERLDGLPLAIEIAASRLRIMKPRELDARLASDLNSIAYAELKGALRHKSISACVNWSYMYLAPAEQRFVLRLSIFRDTFSLSCVQSVCAMDDLDSPEDLLDALAAKSMVQRCAAIDGDTRFRILAPYRAFLQEKFLEPAEVNFQLMNWVVDLTRRLEPELAGPNAAQAVRLLDAEMPNFRAAFGIALECDPALAFQMSMNLARYWIRGQHAMEGRRFLQRAMDFTELTPLESGRAFNAIGSLGLVLKEFGTAVSHLEKALEIFRGIGSIQWIAAIQNNLAIYELSLGLNKSAEDRLLDCVDLYRGFPDRKFLMTALSNLANFYRIHQPTIAEPYLCEATDLAIELEDKWMEGQMITLRAKSLCNLRDYKEASRLLRDLVTRHESVDGHRTPMIFLCAMMLAHGMGDDRQAIRWAVMSDRICAKLQVNARQEGDDHDRLVRRQISRALKGEAKVQRQSIKLLKIENMLSELEEWLNSLMI